MEENDKAKALEEQATRSRGPRELSHGGECEDRPDPLAESGELTQDELGFLRSQVPGHRWNAWRRLTGEEDYYAACSCGWRSTDTGDVSTVLHQVKDHLDAVRAVRGRARQTGPRVPGRAGQERDASQRKEWQERTWDLYAAVKSQQRRLSRALGEAADLLSTSEDQADRLVVALEHAAAGVAPDWVRTEASAHRAEALQNQAERARELRNEIVAAAAALAVIAEEIAGIDLGLETGRGEAIDRIYGEQLIQPTEATPPSGEIAQ
jgi:hypothetical protein